MKVLVDCDVILDVALHRIPHFDHSAALCDWAECNPGRAAVAWHTLANLDHLTGGRARRFIADMLGFLEIPATGTESARFALECGLSDFEDAMQVAAAERFHAQMIATRNVSDFRKSPIRAARPKEILPLLSRG